MQFSIETFLFLAGLAQIVLVMGSLAIPKILNWKPELDKVQVLIKQMFWTYAAYILVINLCFGILSVLAYVELTNGSLLALVITAFISIYWISRILIQFFYFERTGFPNGFWHKLAEIVLVILFACLSVVYSWAFYFNYLKIRL